ncbi:uncharacterized protein F5147DRAFT_672669 [Suillus discolor]|uniref:Uncharacterized protein n=1 Tax=Suillus discolor TaxID=1912936 RepID=A0A9P7FHP2_9AGAM|nr:uncharacterized protein F5147DRAFT_672669 [Suillus discolor]KAG2116420.1 hypothetical protein F5147DRAFT_672669 [Suillus discolor]
MGSLSAKPACPGALCPMITFFEAFVSSRNVLPDTVFLALIVMKRIVLILRSVLSRLKKVYIMIGILFLYSFYMQASELVECCTYNG